MANEISKDPIQAKPQNIPLFKIHDLPGVMISKPPDKSYGGLVTSIQSGGVKEPVILRLREDGEYQLLAGYRRRRASELAKKVDIPALVYEMTLQEAVSFYNQAKMKADTPVPGKLVAPAEATVEQPKKEEKTSNQRSLISQSPRRKSLLPRLRPKNRKRKRSPVKKPKQLCHQPRQPRNRRSLSRMMRQSQRMPNLRTSRKKLPLRPTPRNPKERRKSWSKNLPSRKRRSLPKQHPKNWRNLLRS